MARRGRNGDVLGPVKEGPLGERNADLIARHRAERQALPKGWKFAVRAQEAADAEFEERTARKGVCPRCHMQRACGVNRRAHECW